MTKHLTPRNYKLPLIDSESRETGSLFLSVILTVRKWVFIATSTPTMVPVTSVPFFNSIVTLSWASFIKKRTNFILQSEKNYEC